MRHHARERLSAECCSPSTYSRSEADKAGGDRTIQPQLGDPGRRWSAQMDTKFGAWCNDLVRHWAIYGQLEYLSGTGAGSIDRIKSHTSCRWTMAECHRLANHYKGALRRNQGGPLQTPSCRLLVRRSFDATKIRCLYRPCARTSLIVGVNMLPVRLSSRVHLFAHLRPMLDALIVLRLPQFWTLNWGTKAIW